MRDSKKLITIKNITKFTRHGVAEAQLVPSLLQSLVLWLLTAFNFDGPTAKEGKITMFFVPFWS